MPKDFFKEFSKLTEKMNQIFASKNHDYAGEDDPFSNFRLCEKFGIPAWKGVMVRLSDKFSRLFQFANKGCYEVADESFEDTAIDAAIYLLILAILFQEAKGVK